MYSAKTIAFGIAIFATLSAPNSAAASKKATQKCVYVLHGRCCAYIKNGYCYGRYSQPSAETIAAACKKLALQPSNVQLRNYLKDNRATCKGTKAK